MPKLEDLLKAKGYTDAELESMSTLLNDSRFRGSLEGEIERLTGETEGWAKWYQETAVPTMDKHMSDAQKAREESAAAKERLRFFKENKIVPNDDAAPAAAAPASANPYEGFDPKKFGLVTREELMEVAKMESKAIADAQAIAGSHQSLFGAPLENWDELRQASQESKRSMRQIWEEKYNVAAKRTEIEAKKKADYEAQIRKDEREKLMAEQLNPAARPGVASSSPFFRKAESGPNGPKQPWDSPQDSNARVLRVAAKLVQ